MALNFNWLGDNFTSVADYRPMLTNTVYNRFPNTVKILKNKRNITNESLSTRQNTEKYEYDTQQQTTFKT